MKAAISPPPTITLAMIVRNEADMISMFLDRAGGLWDELVVVDTGSTDDTVSLLERVGARIIRRPWDDDFSAARNAGLRHATGDWIVVLDADEMVSSGFVGEVRALVRRDRVGAATLPMRNPLPSGAVRQTPLLRMFRRDPQIRYEHRIHEDASATVTAMLERRHMTLAAIQAPVDHLGYIRARAAERSKFERDLRLLDRALADDPNDLYAHFKRMELARYWNDRALLAVAVAEAVSAIGVNEAALRTFPAAGAMLCIVARETRGDDPAGAAAWLSEHEPLVLPSAELYYTRGELLERAGKLTEATGQYERALTLGSDRVDQFGGIRAHMGLCRVSLMRGRADRAADHARHALRCNPREPEALLVSLALATARGGSAARRLFVDRHRQQYGDDLSLALALAEDALARRDGRAAIEALQGWLHGEGPSSVARGLAMAHLLCGELERARHHAEAAMTELPEAGLGVLVCDMATGRTTALELDIAPASAHRAMREWTDALIDSHDLEAIGTFLQRVPTVLGLFGWLESHCETRLRPILRAASAG